MISVYLAGGMNKGWRDVVKNDVPNLHYYDPTSRPKITVEEDYTLWDLLAIQKSDILFGYMEVNNPSGIGLALECGYAHALDKKIILVDEQELNPYLGMVRSVSFTIFDRLPDAIELLKSFEGM